MYRRRVKLQKQLKEKNQRQVSDANDLATIQALNMTFTRQPAALFDPFAYSTSARYQQPRMGKMVNSANSNAIDLLTQTQQRRDGPTNMTNNLARMGGMSNFTAMEATTNATEFNHHGNTTMVNSTQSKI